MKLIRVSSNLGTVVMFYIHCTAADSFLTPSHWDELTVSRSSCVLLMFPNGEQQQEFEAL